MSAKALLLVDLQNDFCEGGALAVPGADAIIPVVNQLLPHFDHVIASCDWHPENHISFADNHDLPIGQEIICHGYRQVLWPRHCVAETPGADFHPALNVSAIHKIIYKGTNPDIDSYSAFFDNKRRQATSLMDYLQSQGINTLTVVGLATDYCVQFTVLDALSLGLEVEVIADACRGVDLHAGDCKRALQVMQQRGAVITNADTILKSAGDARHNDLLAM